MKFKIYVDSSRSKYSTISEAQGKLTKNMATVGFLMRKSFGQELWRQIPGLHATYIRWRMNGTRTSCTTTYLWMLPIISCTTYLWMLTMCNATVVA